MLGRIKFTLNDANWERWLKYEILIRQEKLMADFSKLTASITKYNADVETLLAQKDATIQATIDGLQTSVDTEDAKVVAQLNPAV